MSEKRSCQRYPGSVVVDFSPSETKITGVTRDVSRRGMFVRTSRMPETGQRLHVTLRFGDGRQLLVQGRVVRRFEAPDLVRHLFPTGFGIVVRDSESYRRFVESVARAGSPAPHHKPPPAADLRSSSAARERSFISLRSADPVIPLAARVVYAK